MEFNTESMYGRYRSDNIVEILPPKDWKGPETLAHAKENAEALIKLIGEKTVGILVNLPESYIQQEAREFYRDLEPIAVAVAMVGDSLLKKMVGNLLLKLGGFKRPIKIFHTEEEALDWLREKLKASM